ncbi:MAG TPA: hypothetical protein VEA99_12550 [Gemmatimonadaceae bacterium]|nr:hypothetical protein [Gemmatimonadaceae bacterium]
MRRRLAFIALAALAAATALACRGPRTSRGGAHQGPDRLGDAPRIDEREAVARASELRLEPYESVDHLFRHAKSRFPSSVRLVVQDSLDWAAIWRRMVGPGAGIPAPAVDFSREMLLVAGMGEHPCMGYGIAIDTVFRDRERRIYAVVRERHRGVRCGCLNEVVSPVDVIRVPRTARPVTFLERRETNVCEER